MSHGILKVLFFELKVSSFIFKVLALFFEVVKHLLLLSGKTFVDKSLLRLNVFNLVDFIFSLLTLVFEVCNNFLITFSRDCLLAQKKLLFLLENRVDVLFITVSLRELILKHSNDVLDLVDA